MAIRKTGQKIHVTCNGSGWEGTVGRSAGTSHMDSEWDAMVLECGRDMGGDKEQNMDKGQHEGRNTRRQAGRIPDGILTDKDGILDRK